MTPRRRRAENEGLPPNLYTNPLRYRDTSRGGRMISLRRRTLAEAIDYAIQRNAEIAASGTAPRAGGAESIGTLLRRWLNEYARKRYRASTLAERETLVNRYAREWGQHHVRHATRDVLSLAWAPLTPAAYNTHRAMWCVFLRWVISIGILDRNEAAMTLRVPQGDRVRDRLSMADYEAVYRIAEPWFRRAMEVALITGLRRGDLVRLRRENIRDGRLWVPTSKTTRALAFPITDRLADALRPLYPFHPHVIHRTARPVPVPVRSLTNTFRTLVARTNTSDTPPTWHEIRSLGGRAMRARGVSIELIQERYGHDSEGTTRVYLDTDTEYTLVREVL